MTHEKLVEMAAAWLKRERCVYVITETGALSGECPDAIGWQPYGHSILIECKATRNDFMADASKPWRQEGYGVGELRYYLAPFGVITVDDIRPPLMGWGLLLAQDNGRIVKLKNALSFSNERSRGTRREIEILLRMARRMAGDERVTSNMRPIRHILPEGETTCRNCSNPVTPPFSLCGACIKSWEDASYGG